MSSYAVKLSPFINFKHALVMEILHETILHYLLQLLQQYGSDRSCHTKHFFAKTMSRTDSFCIQTLLHIHTHTRFDTQILRHRHVYHRKLLRTQDHTTDTQNRKLTSILNDRTSFRAKRLQPNVANRNFTQFLTIEPHFVRNGCNPTLKSQFYLSFWRLNLIACERVTTERRKSQFYLRWEDARRCEDEKMWRW